MHETVLGRSVHPQETGDLHTLAVTLQLWGKICSAEKLGKVKNKKGKPPGEGNPWANGQARMATGLCAGCIPDACMRDLVCFMVGVWVVFGVVVCPIFGSGVPVIAILFLGSMAT